jgi:hypothetical protein
MVLNQPICFLGPHRGSDGYRNLHIHREAGVVGVHVAHPVETVRRFTTRTGVRGNPLSSATAGRSAPTPLKIRCDFWPGGVTVASQGLRDSFWLQGMLCGFKGAFDCIKAFSETDFTEAKSLPVPHRSRRCYQSKRGISPGESAVPFGRLIMPDRLVLVIPTQLSPGASR